MRGILRRLFSDYAIRHRDYWSSPYAIPFLGGSDSKLHGWQGNYSTKMRIWTVLWIIWAAFFSVIEGTAIIKKAPNATLTAHIVEWASLKNKSGGWLARRGVLAGFAGWLIYHFVSKVVW